MTPERRSSEPTSGDYSAGDGAGVDDITGTTVDTPEESDGASLGEGFEHLPPGEGEELILEIAQQHRGPLPHPAAFAAYEAVHPGAALEILTGAREHRQHRFSMERKVANTARLSLVLTFVAVVAALGIAAFLAVNGHTYLAALFGAGGVTTVLVGMIKGGGRWSGDG